MSKQTKKVAPDLGVEIGGPGRTYFDDVMIDNILEALLELSAELWTVRDRQIVLEKVLAQKGMDVSDMIEQHLPTDEELAERKALRDEVAERIFRSFLRRPTADAAPSADAPSLREIED